MMVLIVFAFFVVVGGVTLDVFWDWFVLPVFVNAPSLTLGTAMGLALFGALFRGTPDDDDEDLDDKFARHGYALAALWIIALIYHYVLGIGP